MSTKKVVLYWRHKGTMKWGQSMIVYPINHPDEQVSNAKPATTSTVLSFDEPTGEFETLNSIYKPYPPKGDSHDAPGAVDSSDKQSEEQNQGSKSPAKLDCLGATC